MNDDENVSKVSEQPQNSSQNAQEGESIACE